MRTDQLVAWLLVLAVTAAGRVAPAQEISSAQAAALLQKTLVDAIARAEPSVVAIARVRKDRGGPVPAGRVNELLLPNRQPLTLAEPVPTSPDFIPNEYATGVVLDRQGHIVTNYHVLGDPDQNDYYVWTRRRPFEVTRVMRPQKVEAGDPWTDLAVLTVTPKDIAAKDLVPITLGDASKLRKGMLVIALGNPYAIARDGEVSASWGMISNLRRAAVPQSSAAGSEGGQESVHQFGTLIQTDVRLNLGTSGGALINLQGEMIGLTTSMTALTGVESPAGFAIPVDESFRQTVNTLKLGKVPSFGFLGVQPDDLTLAERQSGKFGARVLRVVPGTPAAEAGVRPQDIVTAVDGQEVFDKNSLFRELSRRPAETPVQLTLLRRDSFLRRVRQIQTRVVLSKKYVGSNRPAYGQVEEPSWRGVRVDYPWALPPRLSLAASQLGDGRTGVAVLRVNRDSPCWRAGIRRGELITRVQGQRVRTPQQFYSAVEHAQGPISFAMLTQRGDDVERTIEP